MSLQPGTIAESIGMIDGKWPLFLRDGPEETAYADRHGGNGSRWSKILTAILGVLGFVISCYNYLRLTRKDKEERQNQLWRVRTELNERRQEAIGLLMAIQVETEHSRKALKDALEEAGQAGRPDIVQTFKTPLAKFENDASEVDGMVKDILVSIPPEGASTEDIQKLMTIYDEKALVLLKMKQAHAEEYGKEVSGIVELAQKAIRPA